MVNVRKSIECLDANNFYTDVIPSTGTEKTRTITVPTNTRRVKVMLTWVDAAGTVGAAKALVNDIDLLLIAPSTAEHKPLILNTAPSSVNAIATEGRDSINNIEQCVIENPVAGIYTIKVKGTNISVANQQYAIAYIFETNGITVDHPNGGEKWVPGETEKIRWTAYGDESNTFSVEISENGGSTWSTINSAVPANAKSLDYTVPAIQTGNTKIRVSRNSSSLKGESATTFTTLGVPTLTLTNACYGATALSWTAVTGAEGYQVFQLDTDSMKLIHTTTTLSYQAVGLQPGTEQWFAVCAIVNGKKGRRSIAKSILPNSGTCTDVIFDDNLKLVSINTPNTGRHLTNSAGSATQDINVTIRNTDNVASSSSFNMHYSINGGATVTQTINPTIAAGATYNYTFPSHSPSSTPAVYNIKVWIDKPGDIIKTDDTLSKIVRLLSNDAITLPLNEDFESTLAATQTTKTLGVGNNNHLDFNTTSQNYGRLRTFANTGFARSAKNALTIDQTYTGGVITDSVSLTYNLSGYNLTTDQLRADFYVKNHGQEVYASNKILVRGSENNTWINAYDLNNITTVGSYQKIALNINDLLGNAAPAQNTSTSFQIMMVGTGIKQAVKTLPIDNFEDGYTLDDLSVKVALNDIAVQKILSPTLPTCNLSTATTITIEVKNASNSTIANIPVFYQINGGAIVSETISSINANQILNYSFSTTADLSAFTNYTINVWSTFAGDNYASNDSVLNYQIRNHPLVNSFPYLEKFETSDGNWYTRGTNSSYAWGTPTKTIINKAANGAKAWVTSLTANHNDNETSYLQSPCFDLSTLSNPMLSFSKILRIEDDCPCDYVWMEYSTNGGVTWTKLGAVGQGTNWYDNATVQAWQASRSYWHVSTIPIPTNSSTTQFRFVMQADGGVNFEGLGIDDIHVYSGTPIYDGATVTTGLAQTVTGSNWVHFNQGSARIASIHPNGNNLGNTELKYYRHTGAVRYTTSQYYANRNLVIQPTIPPSSTVKIRFYITDAEIEALRNATGCAICTKPPDAYECGVTKFSGTVTNEDDSLANNISGTLHFILPGLIEMVPYENGYYAEFDINTFSEFWFNNGGIGQNEPLPINSFELVATKVNAGANLQWSMTNQQTVQRYIIQKSTDGRRFDDIGTVSNSNASTYTWIDVNCKATSFYRIAAVTDNGIFYTNIKQLFIFSGNNEIIIYPNPTTDGRITLQSKELINEAQIWNEKGQVLDNLSIKNNFATINLRQYGKGIFILKITTRKNVQLQKIIWQ
jgi:hypothetical protein